MDLKEYMLEDKYISYDEDSKKEFGNLGREFCDDFTKKCKCISAKVSYNKAGIACSGDFIIVLKYPEGKYVYVSFNAEQTYIGVLYRTMKHNKDWSGGRNEWCSWDNVESLPGYVDRLGGLKEE